MVKIDREDNVSVILTIGLAKQILDIFKQKRIRVEFVVDFRVNLVVLLVKLELLKSHFNKART